MKLEFEWEITHPSSVPHPSNHRMGKRVNKSEVLAVRENAKMSNNSVKSLVVVILFYFFYSSLSSLHTSNAYTNMYACTSHFYDTVIIYVCSFLCSACCKFWQNDLITQIYFSIKQMIAFLQMLIVPYQSIIPSHSLSLHHQTIFHICCVCYSILQHKRIGIVVLIFLSCSLFFFINLQAKLLFAIVYLTSSKTKQKKRRMKSFSFFDDILSI